MYKIRTSVSGVRAYPTTSESEADAQIHLYQEGSKSLNSADIEISISSPGYMNVEVGNAICTDDDTWEPVIPSEASDHLILPLFLSLDTRYREFNDEISVTIRSNCGTELSEQVRFHR